MEIGRVSSLRNGEATPPLEVRVLRKWIPNYRDTESHYLLVDKDVSKFEYSMQLQLTLSCV